MTNNVCSYITVQPNRELRCHDIIVTQNEQRHPRDTGGRVGSVVARRAIDLKIRGSSPAHGGSRIAG